MNIPLTEFFKIAKACQGMFDHLKGGNLTFTQTWEQDPETGESCTLYSYELTDVELDSVEGLYALIKEQPKKLSMFRKDSFPESLDFLKAKTSMTGTVAEITAATAKFVNSCKLIPDHISLKYAPRLIVSTPDEVLSKGLTYRILTEGTTVTLMAHNEESIYDYLDKGFFIKSIKPLRSLRATQVITDVYDINTAAVFIMLTLQPNLLSMIPPTGFIPFRDAENLKLKLRKKLTTANKETYEKLEEDLNKDYNSNTVLLGVRKVLDGSLQSTTLNNIKFSKTSAAYEDVSIEAHDLLEVLHQRLNFNGEFDIYGLIAYYGNATQEQLDDVKALYPEEEKLPTKTRRGPAPFKVNGIKIEATLSPSGQRYINNRRINYSELSQCVYRASCHKKQEEYDTFLGAVSRMSLARHTILSDGIPVKIHENCTAAEYAEPEAPLHAPRINFKINTNTGKIELEITPERSVRVNLTSLVAAIRRVNKRTNNKGISGASYNSRADYTWARRELAAAVLLTTAEVVLDETTGAPVKDDNGEVVRRATVTKAEIEGLLGEIVDAQVKALMRSKLFMEQAVAHTEAEAITWRGQAAYKVTGALRTYVVVAKTAKTFDFNSGAYICIVNDQHYKGVGYDDVASRLYALKNDSVMMRHINTLNTQGQHEPQTGPGGERPPGQTQSALDALMATFADDSE